jgi:hypothetical protein
MDTLTKAQLGEEEKPAKKQGAIASAFGAMDSVAESGLARVFVNLPFVLFLVLLSSLYITNNHRAQWYVIQIIKTENEVKQLRWRSSVLAAKLTRLSKQSEVSKMVAEQGLKELRTPPIKIEY